MKRIAFCGFIAAVAIGGIANPRACMAHGFEGDRFFPPTLETDDPFAVDEFSFPNIQVFNNPPGPGGTTTREADFGSEFDKEIFPGIDLEFSDTFTTLNPKSGEARDGFQNFTLGTKWELIQVPEHEFIFSAGTQWEIGGTGSRSVGRDSFSTITPLLYAGKGFGDLPDCVPMLKPFAITAEVGENMPTEGASPNALEWGFALEYSLIYLEQNVKDTGMPHPFRDMVPLVEFAATSPENRDGGATTGTINPGVLWESRYFQLGAEAVIPINGHSGPNVGFLVNVNIFIDDMWPKVFGHALFGGQVAESETGGSGK
ncbi:MAG: hypothetical protein ABSE62_14050 [Chthoniobacteraceae bacterium]|jgi:hypothetical protein